jgi:hypothetical protein
MIYMPLFIAGSAYNFESSKYGGAHKKGTEEESKACIVCPVPHLVDHT